MTILLGRINSVFYCKEFEVLQNSLVHKVGTDSFLLGSLVEITDNPLNILDIGTGTGILSLMLAQKSKERNQVIAIDLDSEAFNLAKRNFQNSKYADNLIVKKIDLEDFINVEENTKFDLIVCNPPYHLDNKDISTKDYSVPNRLIQRNGYSLTPEVLIKSVSELIAEGGNFWFIAPKSDYLARMYQCAKVYNLYIEKQIRIYSFETSIQTFEVCCLSRKLNNNLYTKDFVIYKSDRVYSDEYLDLTKDFHLFKQKH